MPCVALREIAFARSGDKGSSANIGVIARSPAAYTFLEAKLQAKTVQAQFKTLGPADTKRYLLPNLEALNFVLEGVLQGGGSLSLRLDSQGKALGQALMEMEMDVPEAVLKECRDA
jgi:hypothetical protein